MSDTQPVGQNAELLNLYREQIALYEKSKSFFEEAARLREKAKSATRGHSGDSQACGRKGQTCLDDAESKVAEGKSAYKKARALLPEIKELERQASLLWKDRVQAIQQTLEAFKRSSH